jgi:2'-5' RNA ligase
MTRLFVAIDLSDDTRRAIATEQKRLAAALRDMKAVRWVQPAQMHVTLVFLGEVEDARTPSVVEAAGRAVEMPAFDPTFEGVGVFPPRGAPRALWVGVGAGSAELITLRQEIAERLALPGVELEDRPFRPHLTLGRWRTSRSSDRRRTMAVARPGPIARVHVECATLYQSRLLAAGPTYTVLARANLTRSRG